MPRLITIFLLFLLSVAGRCNAAPVRVSDYGLNADSLVVSDIRLSRDSLLSKPFRNLPVRSRIEPARIINDRSPDFYLLLALCGILGAIRYTDPRYFGMLLRAARSAGSVERGGLREGIQGAVLSNFLMNLFFAAVAGAYLYYLVRSFGNSVSRYVHYGNIGLLAACIGLMLGIYGVKYAVIRFSGWAFRVQAITDQYIFNVFLINKIIGVVLLPFVVLLAFTGAEYSYSLAGISLLAAGLLYVLRYLRSWPVFASFFEHSRFHFFTYLCASEILPMAVIVKLLLRFAY